MPSWRTGAWACTCGVGAHPEPGQPVHERRARRRRRLQGANGAAAATTPRPAWTSTWTRPTWSALLCRRTAKAGGESQVASTIAAAEELGRRRPDLLEVLKQPFYHHYQGSQDPLQPPYYALPDHRQRPRALRDARQPQEHRGRRSATSPKCRASRPSSGRRSTCSRRSWPTRAGASACSSSRATCSCVNNYVIVHSRTPFEDFEEPDRKRHLLRLWLAVPARSRSAGRGTSTSSTRAGSVRGGLRGSAITPEFLAYEQRQARRDADADRPWKPSSGGPTRCACTARRRSEPQRTAHIRSHA